MFRAKSVRTRSYALFAATLVALAGAAEAADDVATTIAAEQRVPISEDAIGGVVAGANGPEAGVWVIAETHDLQVPYRKIVVTDDAGRFALPQLPSANYKVWVRGYGLADSTPVDAKRGTQLRLTAQQAPTPQAAAQIFPPNYWRSILHHPPQSAFPKAGPPQPTETALKMGRTIFGQAQSHTEFMYTSKHCFACHQIGDKTTRELHADQEKLGSTLEGWKHRVNVGQYGRRMVYLFDELLGPQRSYPMYADWSARIKAGEVPPTPPRPQGIERNVVLSMWDWGPGAQTWVHDNITTDKRNPTSNSYGLVYGTSAGGGGLTVLDPKTNDVAYLKLPTLDYTYDEMKHGSLADQKPGWDPSPFWGKKAPFTESNHPHNAMFDQRGLLWVTTRIRPNEMPPAFCNKDSSNPFVKNYYLSRTESERQLAYYDVKTKQWKMVDTCFSTHHLQFDAHDTLYFSGDANMVGWVDTKVLLETGDQEKAQGWCPAYIDSDGDGKYDPAKDQLAKSIAYGLGVNQTDGSVWFSSTGLPGMVVRIERGANPPATCRSEVYQPPFANPKEPGLVGYAPQGLDLDRNGLVWVTLRSGHLASFDRNKCSVRGGPAAGGQHCLEGWRLYPLPGPKAQGSQESADFTYFNYVDQFNTFGFGPNTPMAVGTNSDSLLILDPEKSEWKVLRVPYPMGFFSRGIDGRIDDAKAGWKGRGLWANSAKVSEWHTEGKDPKPYLVHFQLRPNPLAN